MNRRNMLINSFGIATTALLLPKIGFAQEVPPQLVIQVLIDRNHGHDLQISLHEYLQLLQKVHQENTQTENNNPVNATTPLQIQGTSRHPHTLQLTEFDLISLLTTGSLTTISSEDAGHTHSVQLSLIL